MTMSRRALLAVLALSLGSMAQVDAKPPVKAPTSHDWSRSFAVSVPGGFVMGNPRAKVRVLEYGSLTCPHCRHFAEDAVDKFVANYVSTGRVRYEFRPLMLDSTDLAAFLVARCGGPSRFFPIARTLYATQPAWKARTEDITEQQLSGIPDKLIPLRLAEKAQLFGVAQANGIPSARAKACLVDSAAQTKIAQMAQDATDAGVAGTPFFLINGKPAQVWDWDSLQQELQKAGA